MRDSRNDPLSVGLLIGSILGILVSFIGATGSFVLGVVGYFMGGSISGVSAWVLAGTFVGLASVSLSAGWVAYQSLQGKKQVLGKPSTRYLLGVLALLPVVLLMGTLAFQYEILPALLGPPAHVLAALLPVAALIFIVLQKAPTLSRRRGWGHFMAGIWISPISALILEIIAALPLILIIFTALRATLGDDFLYNLWEQPSVLPDDDFLDALSQLLSQPWILGLFVGYLGLLVPILEELVKSIGLLPLIRREITEAEGFIGGVLAGAGYGLFEAFYLGQPGPGWAALMLARGGATMMHMLTAGLTGIGFARAKNQGRFGPLIRYYLYAVVLHALWNLAAVTMGVGMAGEALDPSLISPTLGLILTIGGSLILIGLTAIAYRSLRRLPTKLMQAESREEA